MENLKLPKEAEEDSPYAFIWNNRILNENGLPLEFDDHKFLIEPYEDMSPRQAIIKSSQIGWSVLAINKALWMAKHLKANIIYTMPSKSIVKDFVTPKVDPIIENNEAYRDWVGKTDSVALKNIGDRFIYFRGCFDKDTEILTTKGWRKYQYIKSGDNILNIDMLTGRIVEDVVEEVFKYDVDEPLYRFKNTHLDLLVTSDHRLVIRKHGNGKLRFMKAEDWKTNDKRNIPVRFKAHEPFVGIQENKQFCKLLGWVIGDGSYWTERHKHRFVRKDGTTNPEPLAYKRVVIIQKNKAKELREFLINIGVGFYEKRKGKGIIGFELDRDVSSSIRYRCPDKKLTQELVLAMDKEQREYLMDGLMLSDGSGDKWYQADRSESEAFQLLVFLLGKNASINERRNKGGFNRDSVDYPVYIKTSKNTYNVDGVKEHYKGKAWCVKTRNGTVITRRNDKICVSGNSWEQSAAISISAHILINDELDRSNQQVVRTYRSRLDDALRERPDLGFIWQFSNPSIPGFGVDVAWEKSDKKHWFVTCPHCSYEWYLKYPDNINFDTETYICAKCKKDLPDWARANGRWVVKNAGAEVSGYWISQLMCSWIPASKIIEDSLGDKGVFHNFTLGLPYIDKEQSVGRETITGCISPNKNDYKDVAIGVDNGVTKTVVIGNIDGIFKIYETDDWQRIEDDLRRYNATMVIDALPYPATPIRLSEEYRGRVFIHYFKTNTRTSTVIEWGRNEKRNVVYSDRTKIIDMIVQEFNNKELLFNMTLTELEQYIFDWTQIYKEVETNNQGIQRPVWKTIEGRRDHYAFSTVYWRIALEKTYKGSGVMRTPPKKGKMDKSVYVSPDQTIPAIDPLDVVRRAKRKKSWKTR